MPDSADIWPHHVELTMERLVFHAGLTEIERWLEEWEIPYRIASTPLDKGTLRVCLADERFVRAFMSKFGGRRIPDDEIEAALNADWDDEDRYQRMSDAFDK